MRLAHNHLWELMASQFLFGVGIGTTYAAMPGLIARSVVTEELGSAVSFNQVRTPRRRVSAAPCRAVLTAHAGDRGDLRQRPASGWHWLSAPPAVPRCAWR